MRLLQLTADTTDRQLDRDSKGFYGNDRKALSELVAGIDTSKPVILLDHQPFNLEDAEKTELIFNFRSYP